MASTRSAGQRQTRWSGCERRWLRPDATWPACSLSAAHRAVFRDATSTADLGEALAVIEPQIEAGFSTFCIKPSQFTDNPLNVGLFCREVIRRVGPLRA
jgi:hypothetical protein